MREDNGAAGGGTVKKTRFLGKREKKNGGKGKKRARIDTLS